MPSRAASNPIGVQALVDELARLFRDQVGRALKVTLDGSETSLAFVDHHLAQARSEDRAAILGLLAAGAGAYYGELVREVFGATWIGDGRDPRRLRLLLEPTFLHFSPVDQAIEAIAGEALLPDDPRIPDGPPLDSAFHLRPARSESYGETEEEDGPWMEARLAELSPVPEDQFHSLTCRFETLKLMVEMLAAKHAHEGREPKPHALEDYVTILAEPSASGRS